MDKGNEVLERVVLPTRIIVHRTELTPAGLAEIVRTRWIAPGPGALCELEAGAAVIARGKIVRRRGGHFFKVLEMAKEDRS